MKRVILISGKARSGKDTTAKIIKDSIVEGLEVEVLSFAEPLKDIIATTMGISLEQLDYFKNECSKILINTIDVGVEPRHYLETTDYRKILQRFGTEAMKKHFGNDIWSKIMYDKIKKSRADVIIISDWKFKSESDYLLNFDDEFKIITCEVIRENQSFNSQHQSEIDLEEVDKDYIIQNDGRDFKSIKVMVEFMLKQEDLSYCTTYTNNYLCDYFKVHKVHK